MSEDLQIGGRIKRLRRARNLSQAQLAETLEISASYLNLIEHNRRRITVPLLFRIAGFFGVYFALQWIEVSYVMAASKESAGGDE